MQKTMPDVEMYVLGFIEGVEKDTTMEVFVGLRKLLNMQQKCHFLVT